MKSTITNAAEITVLTPIDNTLSTGGGLVSVGATVVESPKGWPFSVIQVTGTTMVDKLGKPFHPKVGTKAEGMRQLYDAARECQYVNVVRVVADDAKFPVHSLRLVNDKSAWVTGTAYKVGDKVTIDSGTNSIICLVAHTSGVTEPDFASLGTDWEAYTGNQLEKDAQAYDTTIAVGPEYIFVLYPKDGDPSVNRSVKITVDAPNKRFTFSFYDKDSLGNTYLMYGKSFEVGINAEDVDDMGLPAYIETVLEQNTDFRCDFNDTLTWDQIVSSLAAYSTAQTFTGGTNGGVPTTANWTAAWDIFRNETFPANLMFAAGNYEEDVLANCIEIAELRHTSFFYDVPGYMKHTAAISWHTAAGLESRQAAAYYCPFTANDPWYGGRAAWGASGEAAASCARGDANYTGTIPGIHFSPSGINRGRLNRTGIKPIFEDDKLDRDALYDSRINPVISGQNGGAIIDDCLSVYLKRSYLRFIHVNRILNYIDHRFLEAASYAKFEPDGLTRDKLTELVSQILDDLVTSGALVPPRYPELDGTEPYVLTVEQKEIDLWLVTWDICVTGVARRIAGQPRLVK